MFVAQPLLFIHWWLLSAYVVYGRFTDSHTYSDLDSSRQIREKIRKHETPIMVVVFGSIYFGQLFYGGHLLKAILN